ncbi:hypothetical protein [Persicobacter psychrovividus]|uniref:Uncharacterized protein n=1 Tax=Persicobacter psychrovividus TaxID=387638 RepID=A0ABM7VKA4_9BACT|nr:hypothetical protein PEPS_36830 [Persicobacter psychrovividus]
MWGFYKYDRVELCLKEGKIGFVKNLKHLLFPNDFEPEFKEPKTSKVYLLKNNDFYLYVGATLQPIHTKLAQGLRVDCTNGYHGHNWKETKIAECFVWSFAGMDKSQINSIRAEIVYEIRNKYGKWPLLQNEIHFNNEFSFGREVGKDIFSYLEDKYPLRGNFGFKGITEELFDEPSQYGLRGDPYLWKDLKARFEYSSVTNVEQFEEFLIDGFKENTNEIPTKGKSFFVKHFSFGGMSSGSIDSDFWTQKGFPLLVERFKKLNK